MGCTAEATSTISKWWIVRDITTGLLTQQTNPNSTKTLFTYNNLGEETQRQHQTSVGAALGTFALARRVDGSLTQLVRSSSTTTTSNFTKNLSYDSWGELSQEDDLDGSLSRTRRQAYIYDSNGNRTERDEYNSANSYAQGEIETYDVGNRLSNVNHYGAGDVFAYGESFTGNFDGNGDQTKPIGGVSSASAYSLSFYPDRRLQTVSGSETSSYDGLGRLSVRGSSNFGYDGATDITDRGSGGWTTVERVAGINGDLRVTYNLSTSPTLEYLLYDPLGNVAVVTNTSGTVTENDTSDLYGAYPTQNGSSATGEYDWLGGYGYRYRSSPGVYQVGARAYDPRLGRFMQQDPLTFGMGDYTYAGNDPANDLDPSGLVTLREQNGLRRDIIKGGGDVKDRGGNHGGQIVWPDGKTEPLVGVHTGDKDFDLYRKQRRMADDFLKKKKEEQKQQQIQSMLNHGLAVDVILGVDLIGQAIST